MKKLILIAGAAALATTAPLAAKPDHAKGGHGQGKHGNMKHGGAKHAKGSSKSNRGIVTSDRFGNLYALDARGSCPPGLAKKNNGCMAPGQAKKLFNVASATTAMPAACGTTTRSPTRCARNMARSVGPLLLQ
jgi:hypothetical protein